MTRPARGETILSRRLRSRCSVVMEVDIEAVVSDTGDNLDVTGEFDLILYVCCGDVVGCVVIRVGCALPEYGR